jgi:hypothetical protein
VTVGNGYPSYECYVTWNVENLGTIPVHVYPPEWDDAYDMPLPCANPGTEVEYPFTWTWGTDCWDPWVQLHTDDMAYCTLMIHVEQCAEENNTDDYEFHFKVEARQYNEPRPDVITVESATQNFGSTGWGGWSCPADHPYVVGGTTDCALPLNYEGMAKPGAVTTTTPPYTYPVYPHHTYTPPETGYVVQNGVTGQSCKIYVDCSTAP